MRINLTKKDLVNLVYMQLGFSKQITENLIEDFLSTIVQNIKSEKKLDPTKKRVAFYSVPPPKPKKWPTRPQLGSQNGAKMAKKSMQKCIFFWMPLGIDLWVDFGGIWIQKSSQVDAKMASKINVNSERCVFKK